MRKLFTLFIIAFAVISATAQAPQGINYQAVARNPTGQVLASQAIGVRISIIDGSAGGPVQYSETHAPTTNQFGLFNIIIGNGTIATGTFAAITWNTGNKYIKVEIDPIGGTAYTDMGTTKFQSVPYALAAPLPPPNLNGTNNMVVKFNGTSNGANSSIFDSAGMVGIGNKKPLGTLDVSGNIYTKTEHPSDTVHSTFNQDTTRIGMVTGTEFTGIELSVEPYLCGNGSVIKFVTWGCNTSVNREVMRIDELGNVGIGNMAPRSILEISTDQVNNVFKLNNPNLSNGNIFGMEFGKDNTTNNMAEFRYNHVSDNNALNFINLGLWGNTNTLIVKGNGNVGIGTTTPAAKLDVNGGIKTATFQMTTGAGAAKIMTSDASGNASWTTPTGHLVNIFNGSALGAAPTTANAFIGPTQNVTVVAGQKIYVTVTKALGSTIAGGGLALDLYMGFKLSTATLPSTVGGGILDNRCAQNTRQTFTMTWCFTGLAAGTYTFGIVGNSSSATTWNNNEYGYITVLVFD